MPQSPGIYVFLDRENNVLYIGKALNLKNRVSSYFGKEPLGEKTKVLVSKIHKIRVIKTGSEVESLLLEASLVKKHKPFYNIRLTDDKAYPLIRVVLKNEYPKILLARREEDKNSLYFGPYPSSLAVKLVLRTIRKIFPYQSVSNHPKRFCLYYHLGLCPCPPLLNDEDAAEYKKSIKHIINFLKGNTKKVLRELEKERDVLSRRDEFEKAAEKQRQINSINLITSPTFKPFDYEVNPNLEEDLRKREMQALLEVLKSNSVPIKSLERIECYDISNISGTNATGSMVVFIDGEKDPSEYRRFRIGSSVPSPNDFAMIEHVITRRFNHPQWPKPDLIIIDGGKGQVSSVSKVLKRLSLEIPLIGLAKRYETIITSNFKQISLSRNSDALRLVIRIRDEAHRFAIFYHKELRAKAISNL